MKEPQLQPKEYRIGDMDSLDEKEKETVKHLKDVLDDLYSEDHDLYYKKTIEFAGRLRKKYNNPKEKKEYFLNYKLYHLLTGSSIEKKMPFFDFSDKEDSVEEFINQNFWDRIRQEEERKEREAEEANFE